MSARRGPPSPRPIPPGVAPVLLRWFRRHRRPLPWRRDRDPYRVWVAEVLLQQTRVDQAVPYFERFMGRFPTVRSLAAARPATVLKAWEGAGYYARARHLHAAARELVRHRRGELPRRIEELEALPGVGPYIARAVASIAFGAPTVALEANGLRVAARWLLEEGHVGLPPVRARLADALEAAMPAGSAGAFNEALMELGETICRPVRPRCERCPVAFGCRARAELTDPGALPRRRGRRGRHHVRAAVVVLAEGGRWFVQRRPPRGLLGGLWEFPGGKIERGESAEGAARRELREETGLAAGALERLGTVRHAYSHFSVELVVFHGRPRSAAAVGRGPRQGRWVTEDGLDRLPLPKATQKVVALLRSHSRGPDRPGDATLGPEGRGPGRIRRPPRRARRARGRGGRRVRPAPLRAGGA